MRKLTTKCGVVQSDTPRIIRRMPAQHIKKPAWAVRAELRMKELGLTQPDLAKAAKVSRGAIGHWLTGRRKPNPDQMQILAATLHMTIGGLFGSTELGNVSPLSSTVKYAPLISWVQAGQWTEAVDMYQPGYAEDYVPVTGKVGENAYATKVRGDSMIDPTGIRSYPEGTIIIADPSKEVISGKPVIAKLASGDVTFKLYIEDAGRRYLRPLNPQYPTMEITEDVLWCHRVTRSIRDEE